ncbi:Shedu immune nuclease family protein [Brevibacillus brevis]|uniref:Shedu immune nuclease family protein n=1 Tax=Brevibacillus brevis TaxID=1393 RepID=UPI001EDBC84A|nr:Shedu immune nuclease family protein [Brevibacillus brevis]UKK99762.1 DUF4263 domain-containing protein [Brevibacillus brevis]
MIYFKKIEEQLVLCYSPMGGISWIEDAFENNKKITIGKTFTFFKEDVYVPQDEEDYISYDEIQFRFAKIEGDYFKINKNALGINQELYIHKDIKFRVAMFKTWNNISIFRQVANVIKNDLYIGPNQLDLKIEIFEQLLSVFPNSTELRKYSLSRIDNVLREYIGIKKDFTEDYNSYVSNKAVDMMKSTLRSTFFEYETVKYTKILKRLEYMLENELGFSEKDWQSEIIDILLLIYPKYISVIDEVQFQDEYTGKSRRLDYMLIDSNGNIDIVEIKKPSQNSIISQNKYRDNHIPLKELSGTIMQIEKYLFYLNKWGKRGESVLTERYKKSLPENLQITITNPNAILILGRENDLDNEQRHDLEIIKRKYKNVVDIVTYDELVRRLKRIIESFTL